MDKKNVLFGSQFFTAISQPISHFQEVSAALHTKVENTLKLLDGQRLGAESKRHLFTIAGPNGSGKSTLTNSILHLDGFPECYVTPDEIVKMEPYISIKNELERYSKAMDHSESLRNLCLDLSYSLAFETVFSTKEKLEFLKFAKSKGYIIETMFVTTSDPQINVERVKQRRAAGGHDVPVEKIVSRYVRSMSFLPQLIDVSDQMVVIDNSIKPRVVLHKNNNQVFLLNRETRPQWLDTYLLSPLMSNNNSIYKIHELTEHEASNLKW